MADIQLIDIEKYFGKNYVIRKLNREIGLTVLLVEQKLPFVRRVADSFIILDRGRMMAAAKIDKLNDELIHKFLTV